MNQNERRLRPRTLGPLSHQPSAPGADTDFAWPPSDEDLSACGIILLDGAGSVAADVRVVVHLADVLKPPAPPWHGRPPGPSAAHGPRFRRWGVEQPDYPFHVESDKPATASSSAGETWRAMLALAAGLSLAVLSYAQFRGARGELPVTELAAALAPATPVDTPVDTPVIEADADAGADADAAPRIDAAPLPRMPGERRRPESAGALPPARPALAALAASILDEAPRLEALAAPAPAAPQIAESDDTAASAAPPPAPAAVDVAERVVEPVAAAVSAAYVDPTSGDEDRIRAALTRWRTAYSALDAAAAREVWPSVDARALERAFQALKSQELRFDRCDLTVNGGSAQAACTGRAIYVPRIGKPSPRATPREWTFELKKDDQRWTIASARAS